MAAAQHGLSRVRARIEQVLAVVEYNHASASARRPTTARARSDPGAASPRAHRPAPGRRLRIGQRRQLDPPAAVGELLECVGCHLQRQPRLAAAARADQRQHPRGAEQPSDLLELPFPPDEAGQLLRQVVGQRIERPQRRRRYPPARDELARKRARGARGHAAGACRNRRARRRRAGARQPGRAPPATAPSGRRSRSPATGRTATARGRSSCPRRAIGHPRCGARCARAAPRPPATRSSQRALCLERRGDRIGCARERRDHAVALPLLDRPDVAVRRSRGQHPICLRTASAIASGSDSHNRVEPSMSLNRNVTVPAGSTKLESIAVSVSCNPAPHLIGRASARPRLGANAVTPGSACRSMPRCDRTLDRRALHLPPGIYVRPCGRDRPTGRSARPGTAARGAVPGRGWRYPALRPCPACPSPQGSR